MRKWAGYWWSIVKDYDTEPIQLSNILFLITWAVLFLSQQGSFSSTPTYQVLATIAPEESWAGIALIISVVWISGVFRKLRQLITWSAFIAMFYWIMLSVSTFTANSHSWAWAVMGIAALQAMWIYLRRGT